jgi:hypothetical protein
MNVLGRIDELERNPRTSLELVDWYGDPLVQLVSAVQVVPVRLDYVRDSYRIAGVVASASLPPTVA